MGLIVTSPPSIEPVTLVEACAQVRQDVGVDDAVLTICIAGARAKCEGLIQRPLMTRTYEQSIDAFPEDEIALAVPSVQSITSVIYTDAAGASQTLASTAYALDNASAIECWLLPAITTDWPDTESSINAVRIRYVAGIASTQADVPADVKSWLLLTIGYLYAQREAIDSTGKAVEIPGRFVDSLLDPWRAFSC